MSMLEEDEESRRAARDQVALPVILVIVALFVLVLAQTIQAIHDRGTLSELRSGQDQTVQDAINARKQLESLAGKTAVLANDGDEGARAVVDEMKRQGVTLAPPKQ